MGTSYARQGATPDAHDHQAPVNREAGVREQPNQASRGACLDELSLRLATTAKPIKTEANSQAAAGRGTGVKSAEIRFPV